MWSAGGAFPPPAAQPFRAPAPANTTAAAAVAAMQPQSQATNQKNDIFVGNLAFNTTEEQLHQAFSEIGRVINVRLVTDVETGKPRGFAFVEFQDAQAALSAIRNMNDYELNGRRLRVNFSNSSHLEALAGKLGMDLSHQAQRVSTQQTTVGPGTSAVADSLKAMSKAEIYDVVAKLKEIADRDPDEARRILSGHPQLPEALLYLMSKLDMVKTPLAVDMSAAAVAPSGTALQPPPPRAADPRTASAATAAAPAAAVPTRVDPRQASVDPRQAAAAAAAAVAAPRADPRQRIDPRARAAAPPPPVRQAPPPPPPPAYQAAVPPPPPPPPRATGVQAGVAHLDPALVQQVMSLTPQQIQQLPPDKQQSILQLRQQITGGR